MAHRGDAKPKKLPNGKWQIRYTDEHGARRKKRFGTYNDAVSYLRRREREVEEVRRGERLPTPPDKTMNELFDWWLVHRAPRKRSAKDDESIIRKHLRPALGRFRLRAIALDNEPIEELTDSLLDRLPSRKTVHNILTLLKSQLNLAHDKRWILAVPKVWKPPIRAFDGDYRYLRTKDEIRRFLVAARDEGDLVHATYSTAVLTGLRAGELAALRPDDIDFQHRLFTVQRSFDGPTKAGDLRRVPILDELMPILRRWMLRCPGDLLFPSARGTMQLPSARIFQDVLHRVLKEAKFPETIINGKPRRYITFHGLRHTFASHWMMDGGDLYKLQKILGHKSPQMTMRYAHLAPNAFAGDLHRMRGCTPAEGTVVDIASHG